MAPLQCPTCGGFKTDRWQRFQPAVLWFYGISMLAILPFLPMLAPFILLGVIIVYLLPGLVARRPQGVDPYVCQICGCEWDAHQATPVTVRPNLIQLGNELLEQQARQAEYERQQTARRSTCC